MTRTRIGRPRIHEGTWCCKCRTQDPAAFPPSALKANRGTFCRDCHRKYNATQYGPEYWRAAQQKNRALKQDFVRQEKVNRGCARCEEKHPACLEFHHRDQKAKQFTISIAAQRNWNLERIIEEIKKCDVLCSNCHRKEHWDSVGKWVDRSPLDFSQIPRGRKQRTDTGKSRAVMQ